MRTPGTFAKSVATKIVVFYFLKNIPLEQEILPFIFIHQQWDSIFEYRFIINATNITRFIFQSLFRSVGR